ncbi:RNA polymerase II transcription factor B subunit 2 [Martensiomyces pterosporus]|nr:RNA polymerase II transcription factor B subunit 2 [Martensiomyces pterosporus]
MLGAGHQSRGAFRSTIVEYLESLPTPFCQKLFTKPAACLAIFRLLSTVGKHLVMSMLYLDSPIQMADVHQWAKPGKSKVVRAKVHHLRKLRILVENSDKVSLDPMFREQLRNALTGGGDFKSFGIPYKGAKDPRVTVAWLAKYANEKWEAILHFMVGQSADMPLPSESVLGILKMSRLMENRMGDMKITNSGFQFLLQDIGSQVWTVLLQYLRLAEEQEMDVVEVLNFLFQLVSLQLGRSYSTEALTRNQRKMLGELRDFGLMYQDESDPNRFYPTHLITSLTSAMNGEASAGAGKPPGAGADTALAMNGTGTASKTGGSDAAATGGGVAPLRDEGYIILETNCRVYAYTDSPLQIAILNLFVHLINRFPNFVTGAVTRDSVRRALSNGITADQIIAYMTVHAHPHMRGQMPVLPITVTDQIRLWEQERNRLHPTHAHFYKDFHQRQDFERVFRYAQDLGVILWANIDKRQMVVTPSGHAMIMDMVKKQKMAAASQQKGTASANANVP